MHSKTGKYSYLLLILCFIKPANSTELPEIELSIKPVTCIVKQPGDVCTMTVKVRWQSPRPISSCLYQETTKTLCWQDKNEAVAKVAINFNENMTFTLRDSGNNIFAQQEIIVNTSSSKKYRRRLRSNWSLF
jgi:hypothetical protein